MNSGRFQKIDELLGQLLELKSSERTAFLDKTCAGDEGLRRELESLLSAHLRSDAFIKTCIAEASAEVFTDKSRDQLIGRKLAHYDVLGSLGSGGMGDVYLARDTKLGRHVALKILPAHFTSDRQRIKRFQQEACAASALNHPNILTVYEIGQQDDLHFIATEYVQGDTLRQRLHNGAMDPSQALQALAQVAAALGAAHAAGIVHRDVKPENIMIRPDGLVKVLDFGVAKLSPGASISAAATNSSTASVHTETGTIVGTVHYMSPEQLRGLEIDWRSDLFSLGVVLYETIAGFRPFTASTPTDVIVSILDREPPPLTGLPGLDRIFQRAVAKNRDERYQAANELHDDLSSLLRELASNADRQLICPTCLQINPAGFEFCGNCGAALKKQCSSCKRQVPITNQFCGLCGAQFASASGPAQTSFAGQKTVEATAASAERRRATVVYSIVSGCSAILEQLDPGESDRIMGLLKQSVTATVERHGGVVDRCSGEELVALFGIPTSYEDDYLRAVRAGLELNSQLRALSSELETKLGQPLRAYTGISSGFVVTRLQEDGRWTASGDALQVASRLAAHADVAQVLVSPETQSLIAPFFRLEPLGPIALNPKGEPVTVFRVEGETGVHTRLEASELSGLTRHVGRERELGLLRSSLESALEGAGQLIVVVGDAGVGKSRLVLEFRRTLEQQSINFMQSRCHAYGARIPYLPFIDLLRDLVVPRREHSAEDVRDAVVSNIKAIDPNLESYVPLYLHLLSIENSEDVLSRDLKGDDLRLAIREALAAIFALQANRGPAVLLLEDWHWADEASKEALKRLAGLIALHQVMIVVTCRPEQSLDWTGVDNHTLIHLAPLTESGSIRIVESIIGTDRLPEGLGTLLYRRTGGNPFFIEEVCRALIDSGRVRLSDDHASLDGSLDDLDLPDTIQAVIRTRLDRLDSESQTILRYASVLGREFNLRVLERLSLQTTLLSRGLELLQKQGLIQQVRVVPDQLYRFKHVLTQEVAYDSLVAHRRKTLHKAAGEAIEELFAERLEEQLELLTYHYSKAEAWSKAIRFGYEAAQKASRLSRFPEALNLLEQAESWVFRLADSEEKRQRETEILLSQERICETLGMRERQQELIDRVISLLHPESDQSLLAEVLVRQGELYTLLGRFEDAESALVCSLEIRRALADSIGERVVLRNMGFLHWQQGRYEDAVADNKTALAIDLKHEDLGGYAKDLTNLASILRSQGKANEALEYVEEALKITERLGRPFSQVYTLTIAAHVRRDLGQSDRAKEHYRLALELQAQHRLPLHQFITGSALASLCWERGEYEEGLTLSEQIVTLTRELNLKRELAQAAGVLGQRLLELEQIERALPYLHEAAGLFSQLDERAEQVTLMTTVAYVYERSGSHDQAAAMWREVRSLRSQLNESRGEMEAIEGLARIARNHSRDDARALQYLEEASKLAIRLEDAAKRGDLLNTMGIIEWSRGDYASALSKYEDALELFLQLGDLVHAGLILNSIGVTLHRLGRPDEALVRLDKALQLHRSTTQRRLEGHALAAIGDILTDTNSFDRAIECYKASIDLRRALNDRKGEGWMLERLARVNIARGETEQARAPLTEALNIARDTGDEQLKQAVEGLLV